MSRDLSRCLDTWSSHVIILNSFSKLLWHPAHLSRVSIATYERRARARAKEEHHSQTKLQKTLYCVDVCLCVCKTCHGVRTAVPLRFLFFLRLFFDFWQQINPILHTIWGSKALGILVSNSLCWVNSFSSSSSSSSSSFSPARRPTLVPHRYIYILSRHV